MKPGLNESLGRPVPDVLRSLVQSSRERAHGLGHRTTFAELAHSGRRFVKRSLAAALRSQSPAVITEVKKASPSRGVFRSDFDPIRLAGHYRDGGAAAISVVTEPGSFLGEPRWIAEIRELTGLPVLRKDFIVDPIQVAESAALGADAILLIARILTAEQLSRLYEDARSCGLEVLFEAHDLVDVQNINAVAAGIVGVNARNLDDFTVDTARLIELRPHLPHGTVTVAESGLHSPGQIARLTRVGYHGFLIGESLIRSNDPAGMLRHLCRTPREQ